MAPVTQQPASELTGHWTEQRKVSKGSIASLATCPSLRSTAPTSASTSRDTSPDAGCRQIEATSSDASRRTLGALGEEELLLREHPVKNTFIHFPDDEEPRVLRRTASAPSVLAQTSCARPTAAAAPLAAAASEHMVLEHKAGACRPCAYFLFKADGCRNGPDCEFCHVCTTADIKKFKRERAKAAKANAAAASRHTAYGVGGWRNSRPSARKFMSW